MNISDLKSVLPEPIIPLLEKEGISDLRPAQQTAIDAGLLKGNSVLVCTPTASGKTLIAELACLHSILSGRGKAVYIVPLKALANEKFKEFSRRWGSVCRVALSIGDLDTDESNLQEKDLIICTAEKLDALMRHHAVWTRSISCVVIDEIHLLNDPGRGPTLEILITMIRQIAKQVQLLGLSATIGNPQELADWLDAKLVVDDWRPVPLFKGIYYDGVVEFDGP